MGQLTSGQPGLLGRAVYLVESLVAINQALNEINAKLSARGDLSSLLDLVLAKAYSLLPPNSNGQCLLVRGGKLVVVASTDGRHKGWNMPATAGVSGWAIANDTDVLIEDLDDHSDRGHPAAPAHATLFANQRSEVTLRLRAANRSFGVLNFEHASVGAFTTDDKELLGYFATATTAAVLASEKQERLIEASNLLAHRVGQPGGIYSALLDTMKSLGAEHAQVLAYNDVLDTLTIIASTNLADFVQPSVNPDQSVCGLVARTKELRNFDDVTELERQGLYERRLATDALSELAVPVLKNGVVTHVLNAESSRRQHFGAIDEHVMTTLAAFVSIGDNIEDVFERAVHSMSRPIRKLNRVLRAPRSDGDSVTLDAITPYVESLSRTVKQVGARNVDVKKCSLEGMLRGILAECYPSETRIEVDWESIVRASHVLADEAIACETVEVIVNNALDEFAASPQANQRVRISAVEEGDSVEVAINDNGRGIPEDSLAKIFFRFYSTKGTMGVGLSFAKKYMRQIGGDVMADSRTGEGTTFTLRFRIAQETIQSA